MAVLAALIVVVAVNAFLFFGYYAPAGPPAPSTKSAPLAEESTSLSTVPESTGGQEGEGQRLRETTGGSVPSGGADTTASPSAPSGASPSPP